MDARQAAIRELARRELLRRQSAPAPTEREQIADGVTLRPFGIDTGIEMPQGVTEALAGAGRRMTDIATLGNADRTPEADALLDNSGYAMAGGAAVDLATMVGGGGALKAASAIPKVGRLLSGIGGALQAPKTLSQAVVAGGAYGAATDPNRMQSALAGASGGGIGYGVPRVLGGLLKPELAQGAEELLKRNVKLTIGETLGGAVKAIEDGLTSIPGLGSMIRKAKDVSLLDFNRAVFDEVLQPLGIKVGDTMPLGHVAYQEVDNIIRSQYHELLPGLTAQMDVPFLSQIGALQKSMRNSILPKEVKQGFDDLIDTHIMPMFKNPTSTATGESYKEVDSLLGKWARGLQSGKEDYYMREFGNAISETQKALRGLLARQNPAASSKLRRIDASYARLKTLDEVMKRAKVQGRGGVFTPSDVIAGIGSATKRGRKFRHGKAPIQKTAIAAADRMATDFGNSGSIDRALVSGVLMAPGTVINEASMAGAAGGAALYSQTGQDIMRALATQRPQGMLSAGQGLRQIAPGAGTVGISGMLNYQ